MSKTKRTTKIATLHGYLADIGDTVVGPFPTITDAHRLGGGCVTVVTSCGNAAWSNSFSPAMAGDRVVLRKNAPRSHGDEPWVMTGWAG